MYNKKLDKDFVDWYNCTGRRFYKMKMEWDGDWASPLDSEGAAETIGDEPPHIHPLLEDNVKYWLTEASGRVFKVMDDGTREEYPTILKLGSEENPATKEEIEIIKTLWSKCHEWDKKGTYGTNEEWGYYKRLCDKCKCVIRQLKIDMEQSTHER